MRRHHAPRALHGKLHQDRPQVEQHRAVGQGPRETLHRHRDQGGHDQGPPAPQALMRRADGEPAHDRGDIVEHRDGRNRCVVEATLLLQESGINILGAMTEEIESGHHHDSEKHQLPMLADIGRTGIRDQSRRRNDGRDAVPAEVRKENISRQKIGEKPAGKDFLNGSAEGRCRGPGLNRRLQDLQSCTLPTELPRRRARGPSAAIKDGRGSMSAASGVCEAAPPRRRRPNARAHVQGPPGTPAVPFLIIRRAASNAAT